MFKIKVIPKVILLPEQHDVICEADFSNQFHVDGIVNGKILGVYMDRDTNNPNRYVCTWPEDIKYYVISSSKYPDVSNLGSCLML